MAETDVGAAENGFAKATPTADQNKTPKNTNYDTSKQASTFSLSQKRKETKASARS